MKPQHIAWIDLETTGLYPDNGRILELAIILTTTKLIEVDRASWVIYTTPERLRYLSSEVEEMHRTSGLLDDLARANPHKNAAEAAQYQCIKMIMDHCPAPPILAGYRVTFDRKWLIRWMPLLEARLSDYTLDVSCLRDVMSALGVKTPPRPKPVTHRAMDDCDAALAEMRGYETKEMM